MTNPADPVAELSRDDAWLASLLKDEPRVDDNGFTDGVMARLPRRSTRTSRFSKRDITLVLSGAAAGAVGAFGFARGTLALDTPAQMIAVVVVVGLGLWAALASSDA